MSVTAGVLIVNADDWGRDRENSDRTLACLSRGTVSCVSAMVFMEDSERAAEIALERGLDAGLHLNLTTPFSASTAPARLVEHQQLLSHYLKQHRLAPIVFHPGLARSFDYVVAAQRDEFERLYRSAPARLDGHHHMHLCANVLLSGMLPVGTAVRRNFTFQAGEKSVWNRLYRRMIDRLLARRHRLTDYFYSLSPLEPRGRLDHIFSMAQRHIVEVECHPVRPEEYNFLTGDELLKMAPSRNIDRMRTI